MSFNANDLGDLQIDVLRTLWTLGEATVHEVLSTIERQPPPAYTTVLTVLRSLEKRGLVAHFLPCGDRQYRYRPLLDAEEAERTAVYDILKRVFEGSVERMVARVIEAQDVTVRDLCALRCLLDRALASMEPPDGESRVGSERPSRPYSPLPSEERAIEGRAPVGAPLAAPDAAGSRASGGRPGEGVRALTPHASRLTPDRESSVKANGSPAALPEPHLSESLGDTRRKLSRSLRRNTA